MTSNAPLTQPLVFQPLFMERIWGGRRLESLYGMRLPPGVPIGESWELVDRPEAQSVVDVGPWRGRTLHDLWINERQQVFGTIDDAPRFPLLIKLLDAQEKLSVQVHPPAAELYVGLTPESSRAAFEAAIANGDAHEHLHRLQVTAGDAMFLPSGRVHAIGAGNVIVEIQQNSDTTYRVFDWNRTDSSGNSRQLHVEESLRAIDFDDRTPALVEPIGESMVQHPLFHIDKWSLESPRKGAGPGQFAVICCVTGSLECAGVTLNAGGLFLLPASLVDCTLRPVESSTHLLRVTVPAA